MVVNKYYSYTKNGEIQPTKPNLLNLRFSFLWTDLNMIDIWDLRENEGI